MVLSGDGTWSEAPRPYRTRDWKSFSLPESRDAEERRTSNPACVLKSGPVRAAHPGTRGTSGTKGLWRITSSATVSRGSSVTPAWVQRGSLVARSGANSAVMQRSRIA
jgi:hypothetical protein